MADHVDLDEWEREQVTANQRAADFAMFRLSQRYGWGLRHPSTVRLAEICGGFTSAYRKMRDAIATFSYHYTGGGRDL